MRYLGGKARTGKQIAAYLNAIREPGQSYWEPFVGSAWVLIHIKGEPNYASDICKPLISMWRLLQRGWEPPSIISEEDYKVARAGGFPPHYTAFIGFGCSWSGKWFGGYARSGERNYALNAKNSLLKKMSMMPPVSFFTVDYQSHPPPAEHCLIYCDPPYQNTTRYDYCKGLDFDVFWNTMRAWRDARHAVVISEYQAPPDFECVLEIETKTDLRTKQGKEKRIERLWR